MKGKKLKIVIIIFSMLLSSSTFAQKPQGGQGGRNGGEQGKGQQRDGKSDASEILSKLDTNNDNKIDKDEASNDRKGKISEDFDEIDTTDDGFIDLEELKASLNDRKPKKISAKKVLKEVDDNGDGTLNELEVAAKEKLELSKNFIKIDTNHDDELDLEELKTFYDKIDKPKRKKRK